MNVYAPGKRFGRLTLVRYVGEHGKHAKRLWEAMCDCGKITIVQQPHISNGHTKSCGCIRRAKPLSIRIPEIMQRVFKRSNGCWIWMGALTDMGYGHVSVGNEVRYVHIILWEHANGPVPEGLELDHLCQNPPCCNPEHLEPVTHRENLARGNAPAWITWRKNNGIE